MATQTAHGPESDRIHRIARRMADARERSMMASATGDYDGARYAAAEASRLRRILAAG